jgi:hypothetical protein
MNIDFEATNPVVYMTIKDLYTISSTDFMPMPVEKAFCTTCLHLSRMVPVQYRPC